MYLLRVVSLQGLRLPIDCSRSELPRSVIDNRCGRRTKSSLISLEQGCKSPHRVLWMTPNRLILNPQDASAADMRSDESDGALFRAVHPYADLIGVDSLETGERNAKRTASI